MPQKEGTIARKEKWSQEQDSQNVKGPGEGNDQTKVDQKSADAVKSTGTRNPRIRAPGPEWGPQVGGGWTKATVSWLLVLDLPKTPRDPERIASRPQNGGRGQRADGCPPTPVQYPVPGVGGRHYDSWSRVGCKSLMRTDAAYPPATPPCPSTTLLCSRLL